MTKLTRDAKQYAKLLLSVGQHGRSSSQIRPLNPVECAEMIKQLMSEENENLEQVTQRLDLGRPAKGSSIYKKRDTTQVTVFLNLLRISEKSRYFAGWKWEGYPKIPFSLMALMAPLAAEEQDKIIQSAYNDDKKSVLNRDDVRKIIQWKRDNPSIPIEECIQSVLELKPVSVTTHMLVCEIHPKLKQFIISNQDYRDRLITMLNDNIEGKFYDIDATDILITISMDETAYKTFHDQQYKKSVSFTQFLNRLVEDKIG